MGLLDIKPNVVSKDLRGYSVMFYGTPKSGKTTTASKFPGAVIFAFEKGFSAIPGAMANPLYSWNDFKKSLKELEWEESKKLYQTVVIDTADIAYDYCSKYICARESDATHDYNNLGDLPYGKGYKMAELEFDESIRRILQLNYGLVLISHSQDKTFTATDGTQYDQIIPTLDTRARKICERTCDIIGYSHTEFDANNDTVTWLELRGTPRYVAGSRFRYTPDRIKFSYQDLVDTIAAAIDKEAEEGGQITTAKNTIHQQQEVEYDFDAMMSEFQTIVGKLMSDSQDNAKKITAIVDKRAGKGKKVGEFTEANAPALDLILYDLRALVAKKK